MYLSVMDDLVLTDLPDDVMDLLRKRAELADMTAADYVKALVVAQTRQPSLADLIDRARADIPADRELSESDIRQALEEEREL